MASVYDKYYERQPPAVKVIVAAGVGLLGYSIYQAVKRNKEEKDAAKAAAAAAAELAALAAQGVYPSYGDSQFYVFVNTLVQAMTGCGTDETLIYQVFRQIRNEADIRRLIQLFGVQYYQPCVWTSPVSYTVWQVNDKAYGGDLATWLSYDLGQTEISNINSILKGNGLTFQF
jgi:hypothetical protein